MNAYFLCISYILLTLLSAAVEEQVLKATRYIYSIGIQKEVTTYWNSYEDWKKVYLSRIHFLALHTSGLWPPGQPLSSIFGCHPHFISSLSCLSPDYLISFSTYLRLVCGLFFRLYLQRITYFLIISNNIPDFSYNSYRPILKLNVCCI